MRVAWPKPEMHQYIKEIQTCFRLGERWSDRVRLSAACLEFHLSNLLRLSPARTATSYRLSLDGSRQVHLRRRSGDFFIFHEIFTCLCYALPQHLLAGTPAVIVDLGANVGFTTLFLASQFPRARYISVEPNPVNVALLRSNLSFLSERVEVVEAAVSNRTGDVPFMDTDWSWGGHVVETGPSNRTVSCVTLEDIMSRHGIETIDILKVDVEGAEKQIFSGRPSWLTRVGCVITELHNDYSIDELRADLDFAGLVVLEPNSHFGNTMIVAVPRKNIANASVGAHNAAWSQAHDFAPPISADCVHHATTIR